MATPSEKKLQALISFCEDIESQIAWLRGEVLKEMKKNKENEYQISNSKGEITGELDR